MGQAMVDLVRLVLDLPRDVQRQDRDGLLMADIAGAIRAMAVGVNQHQRVRTAGGSDKHVTSGQ